MDEFKDESERVSEGADSKGPGMSPANGRGFLLLLRSHGGHGA